MKNGKLQIALTVLSIVLAVAGIVLVLLSMFAGDGYGWALPAALSCVLLGNVLNLVRYFGNRKS
ncbi:MAG: hypothetical protein II889_02065 [Clostridia bacterium]|nr:hypothetical protein [Clostridia bacterium]MCR4906081.1 hypothetical protein [Clostridiales bacterium]